MLHFKICMCIYVGRSVVVFFEILFKPKIIYERPEEGEILSDSVIKAILTNVTGLELDLKQ